MDIRQSYQMSGRVTRECLSSNWTHSLRWILSDTRKKNLRIPMISKFLLFMSNKSVHALPDLLLLGQTIRATLWRTQTDEESQLTGNDTSPCSPAQARDQAYKEIQSNGLPALQPRKKLVAASLGCYGASLANGAEYSGDYGDASIEDLMEFHRHRLRVMSRSGADVLAFETVPSLLEAQVRL